MSTDDQLLVIWQTAEHATCTRHRSYMLYCEDWDEILKRSGGKCELCGADGRDLAWGRLHIDHEHHVGKWAVRGLLCDACNHKLRIDRRIPQTDAIKRYLENAWYRKEIERLGLTLEMPPEPGEGSSAAVFGRHFMRIGGRWICEQGSRSVWRSWNELWRTYGPINIRITDERDTIPDYVRRLPSMRYILKAATAKPKAATPLTKAILEERLARALAIAKRHNWHPDDQDAAAELVAILTIPSKTAVGAGETEAEAAG